MTKKEKNKYQKIIEKAIELCNLSDVDEMIYGNSYIEFTERGIKVIHPENIVHEKRISVKPKYGTSVLEKTND